MFSFSRRKCTTTVYQYIQRIYSRIQSHVLDFQKGQHTSNIERQQAQYIELSHTGTRYQVKFYIPAAP